MNNLPGFLQGWPVWAVFLFLTSGAYTRGNATYWVGRGLRAGGERSRRLARHSEAGLLRAAELWVSRWGAPVITVGYLTVGVQTAIVLSAGALRMPQRRFQPAVLAGSLVWAAIYTTVGFAVLDAWLGRLSWWWALVGVGVIVVMVTVSRAITKRQVEPHS